MSKPTFNDVANPNRKSAVARPSNAEILLWNNDVANVNNGGYWPPPLARTQLTGEVATELASIRLMAFRLT